MSNVKDIITLVMESITLGADGETQVLDEAKLAEADALLHAAIAEQSSAWWESAEANLAGMSDEIAFGELNADASSLGSSPLAIDGDADEDPMAALESALGSSEFDLNSIFENDEEDDEDEDDADDVDESVHVGEDDDVTDGDDEWDNIISGNDEDGIGGGAPLGDELGNDGDEFGGDMGGDEFVDPMDGDVPAEDGEFDFKFLDEPMTDGMPGDEFGDDMGGDEFGDEIPAEDGMDEFEDGVPGEDEDEYGPEAGIPGQDEFA